VSGLLLPPSLVYGSDDHPGIRRIGRGPFRYVGEDPSIRVSAADRERIARLAIPPAWTSVWISADPDAHLQATGRDARGRKQYRYHQAFTEHQGATKFGDLADFGAHLGALRRAVSRDLESKRLEHDHVVAVLVRLLDLTYLRVGNEVYAQTNKSFGLTTLRNRHLVIRGSSVRLRFTGKSAHNFDVAVEDKRLAQLVRRCHALPGQHLFQYEAEDGTIRRVGSSDVNEYLREHGSPTGSAKTFRTWGATVLAAELFADAALQGETPTPRAVTTIVKSVSERLGNTPAVCRASYIHPQVIERFLDGSLEEVWTPEIGRSPAGLSTPERRVLRMITPKPRARARRSA
jgi:DNA topoisomerase-1